MTRLDLLLHIKGLVLNDKTEAAFDLIRVEFDDYEDIVDLFLLQNQYNRLDSNMGIIVMILTQIKRVQLL